MRRTALPGFLAALAFLHAPVSAQRAGAVTIQPGEECPAGMTEVRPRTCQAPEIAPPSILDYRPRSSLITTETMVPKPKYPTVDFHGHPPGLDGSAEGLRALGAAMDEIGLRVMVAASNVRGERLRQVLAGIDASPTMRDRVRVFTGIDFSGVGPGWAERAVQQLEADVAAGAVGIGEISKSFGQSIRKADGSRLRIDDPELDPVWQAAARLRIPVFIHTADPQDFYRDFDYTNERWLELALFPNRRIAAGQPSFAQLAQERDNLFRRNPSTTFVMAHMGWQANDLATLGELLDELPNLYTEVGAVLYDIGRQPRAARDFFIRYQDRILFGKDSFQPGEYPYFWRVFETDDDYFDYYRPYHAFWKLYGIDLPDVVLKKLYYANALRITPGLPQGGWPQ
ncbi:MAG: amidohydrolase family protein [Gemmatimonadetes bacterium]|nr:amidohydrolase family protein [Gemmatimonadota bacterium]